MVEGSYRDHFMMPLCLQLIVCLIRGMRCTAEHRDAIKNELQDLLGNEGFYNLVVAKANTADAIKKRLDAVERLLHSSIDVWK